LIPPFPFAIEKRDTETNSSSLSSLSSPASSQDPSWTHKPYPSGYLSLEDRMSLALSIWNSLGGHLLLSTRLLSWKWNETTHLFELEMERGGQRITVISKFLLLCGGRLSPLEVLSSASNQLFVSQSQMRTKFFRIEVGVRIEMEHTAEFFSKLTVCSLSLSVLSHVFLFLRSLSTYLIFLLTGS
jgi:hypothetical protein